jgi:nicotinamidase-related amidase
MTTPPPTLLIIDMQKGMSRPEAGPRNNPLAESNIEKLLNAWRASGAPIVHIRHASRWVSSPFRPGQPGADFQEALKPLEGEHVVEKNVPDAFANSALQAWLRSREINELVITGVSTSNSVESTARSAGNLGFLTRVVSDATFTFDKKDYDGNHRTAAEVHAMSLANLDGEYASIVSTDEVIAALSNS